MRTHIQGNSPRTFLWTVPLWKSPLQKIVPPQPPTTFSPYHSPWPLVEFRHKQTDGHTDRHTPINNTSFLFLFYVMCALDTLLIKATYVLTRQHWWTLSLSDRLPLWRINTLSHLLTDSGSKTEWLTWRSSSSAKTPLSDLRTVPRLWGLQATHIPVNVFFWKIVIHAKEVPVAVCSDAARWLSEL